MMRKRRPTRPEQRPLEAFHTTVDLGRFVGDLRRTMEIRQEELALRAQVSRQWVVGLEQGKPAVELALVLRTLGTLGFELMLRPTDPLPRWILRAKSDAELRRLETRRRRNARRRTVARENARDRRLSANYPTVLPDLE